MIEERRLDVRNKLPTSIDPKTKILLVDLNILFFVKRFGFVILNKNTIHRKTAFTFLSLFLRNKHANMMGNTKSAKEAF